MRTKEAFLLAGLSEKQVEERFSAINRAASRNKTDKELPPPTSHLLLENKDGRTSIELWYGDVTDLRLLDNERHRGKGKLRAIVSPDDTCLSAAGGVARAILECAGDYSVLNELHKWKLPVKPRTVVVTTAGHLPLHYIFHCALADAKAFNVKMRDIEAITARVIELAEFFGDSAIWVPLMGAGTGGMNPADALTAIARAVKRPRRKRARITVIITVYSRETLDPIKASKGLESSLGRKWARASALRTK